MVFYSKHTALLSDSHGQTGQRTTEVNVFLIMVEAPGGVLSQHVEYWTMTTSPSLGGSRWSLGSLEKYVALTAPPMGVPREASFGS